MPFGRRHLQWLLMLVAMAGAVGAGFLATSRFQRSVSLVPGIEGCLRLDGSAPRSECLGAEFQHGVKRATSGRNGEDRDDALVRYVSSIDRMASGDSRIAGSCHPAMHVVGRTEGRAAARQSRIPKFPDAANQLCTAGYVHGLSEGYLEASPTADVGAVFPKLCYDVSARPGCAHGIGHALLRGTSSTPGVRDARHAVERCEPIPEAVRTDCESGVYMELAMRTDPVNSVSDFVSACRGADTVERELSCWNYLGLSLTTNDVPPSKTPTWCSRAPREAQYACIEGYGRQLGVDHVRDCEANVDDHALVTRCVNGAVALQVGSGHVSPADARTSCGSIRSHELEAFCEQAVVRYSRGREKVLRDA
jgi:hypothetical protein